MTEGPDSNISPGLTRVVAKATWRVRFLRTRRFGADGLFIGSLFSAILLLTLHFLHYEANIHALWWLVVFAGMGLVFGTIFGFSRPVPAAPLLRLLERRLDLKERFSTAYELRGSDQLERLQIFDAEDHTKIDFRSVLPFLPIPTRVWAAILAPFAVFLLTFLPELPFFQSPERKLETAAVKKEGERLIRLAKALERDSTAKKLPKTDEAAKELEKLGNEMKTGRLNRRNALMKTAKLTEEIKRQQAALAAEQAPKSLSSAAKELEKSLSAPLASSEGNGKSATDPKNSSLKPESSLANSDRGNSGNGSKARDNNLSALRDLQNALAKSDIASLSDKLARLSEQVAQGKPASPEERKKLARELDSLARALKDTRLSEAASALKQASDALEKGEMPKAAEKLREAVRKTQQEAQRNADADSLQQMADTMSNPEAQEGAVPSDTGEGDGEKDAFTGEGEKKGASEKGMVEGPVRASEGQEGDSSGASGKGKPRNGIGSEAGKLGGAKPATEKGGRYLDARDAPDRNKTLKNSTQKDEVRDSQFNRIYAPDGKSGDSGGGDTRVHGKRDAKGRESVSFMKGAPGAASASTPYYEVYEKYAPAVEQAIHRDDIPANYRQQVRQYFDAMKPGKP